MRYRLFCKHKDSDTLAIIEGCDEAIKYLEEHEDAIPIKEDVRPDTEDWHRLIR